MSWRGERVPIRAWRVVTTELGVMVFCDPRHERLELYSEPWTDPPGGAAVGLELELQERVQLSLFEEEED
jgi:hypothetical protein